MDDSILNSVKHMLGSCDDYFDSDLITFINGVFTHYGVYCDIIFLTDSMCPINCLVE